MILGKVIFPLQMTFKAHFEEAKLRDLAQPRNGHGRGGHTLQQQRTQSNFRSNAMENRPTRQQDQRERCYICNKPGHFATQIKDEELQLSPKEGTLFSLVRETVQEKPPRPTFKRSLQHHF